MASFSSVSPEPWSGRDGGSVASASDMVVWQTERQGEERKERWGQRQYYGACGVGTAARGALLPLLSENDIKPIQPH